MAEKKTSKSQEVLFVSAKELSLMLGISVRQIWRLRATGQLPKPIYLGSSVKWKINEIAEWVESNCPDLETWQTMKETSK